MSGEVSTDEEEIRKEYPNATDEDIAKIKNTRMSVLGKPQITVNVTRDDSIVDQNKVLTKTLEHIANLEFDKRKKEVAHALGIGAESIETPEDLKAHEAILERKKAEGSSRPSSSVVPLTSAQVGSTSKLSKGIPPSDRVYDSLPQMLEDLREESENNESPFQSESKEALAKLTAKALKTKWNV